MSVLLILFFTRWQIRPPLFVRRQTRARHYHRCHKPGHEHTCQHEARKHGRCPHQEPLTAPSRRRTASSYLDRRTHRLMPPTPRSGGPRWVREPMVQTLTVPRRRPEACPQGQRPICACKPQAARAVESVMASPWRQIVEEALHENGLLDRRVYGAAYGYANRRAEVLGRPRTANIDFAVWYTVNRGHARTATQEDSLALWYEHWLAGRPGTPGILEKVS